MHVHQFWWAWPLHIGVMAPFCLPSKMARISLQTMDYSPWGVKKQNHRKKSMQVEVDVKCMQTYFGGCGCSGF